MLNKDNDYWLSCWQKNTIPFHRATVNPLLEKHWPSLNLSPQATVFVPLCGKSHDLYWLATRGHRVIGVELSDVACEDFFTEHHLPFNKKAIPHFTVYENNNIALYCGDFFKLDKNILSTVEAVYDRAALIALPHTTRKKYAHHLIHVLPAYTQVLLLSHDSPDTVEGPPYTVSPHEIQELFGKDFQIEQLEQYGDKDISEHLWKKGYREICDYVYYLKRRNQLSGNSG